MTEYSQKYWEVCCMLSPSQSCPFDPMTFTNESQLSHPRLAAIFKKCRTTEHRTSLPPPEKKGEKGEVEKGRSTEGHGATLKKKNRRGKRNYRFHASSPKNANKETPLLEYVDERSAAALCRPTHAACARGELHFKTRRK